MIACYQTDRKLYQKLLTTLDERVVYFQDYNKCFKFVKKMDFGDKLISYNYQNGVKLLDVNFKIKTFPNKMSNLIIGDKKRTFSILNRYNIFPLKRSFYDNVKEVSIKEKMVLKIGNEHQGKGKYIVNNLKELINTLKKNKKILKKYHNVFMLEEFINNARSIRIIKMEDEIFIVEQINNHWLKNVIVDDSFSEVVWSYSERKDSKIKNIDDIIKKTEFISSVIKSDYVGVDFVVTDDRVGLLEVNDMIGIPDDERVFNTQMKYFINWIKDEKR